MKDKMKLQKEQMEKIIDEWYWNLSNDGDVAFKTYFVDNENIEELKRNLGIK